MSHEIVPPPAVARSRDTLAVVISILSVLFLLAGVALGLYTGRWYAPMALISLAVLGVLAMGIRLAGLRKHLNSADLRGEDNSTEPSVND